MAAVTRKRPLGRSSCHGVDNKGYLCRRDHSSVPPGIPIQKNPQRGTLLGGHHRRDSPGDFGDTKGAPPVWLGSHPAERESRQRTSRMPGQAEFHAQVQVAYNHLGYHLDWQQESQEEALQLARDVHHQVLVTAAMLEKTYRVTEPLHLSWVAR